MKNNKSARIAAIIVAFAVILYGVVTNIGLIYGGLRKLWGIFSTVITGALLAFMLNVLMEPIENRWLAFLRKSKWKYARILRRALAILLTYLIAIGIIAVILLFLIPQIKDTVISLAERFPGYVESAIQWVENRIGDLSIAVDSLPTMKIDWEAVAETVSNYLKNGSVNIIGTATGAATSVINGVANVFLSLILSVYILAMKERIGTFFARIFHAFLPEKTVGRLERFLWLCSYVFSNFFAHQMLECLILGVMCYIGMLIFRIPYALVISMVIAFTQLVPMVGPLIGEVIGAFILLTVSPVTSLLFLVFILILQQVENSLVYPRIVGKSIGLPGLLTFITVIVGGKIGGVPGAFLGVPIVAVLYLMLKEVIERKENAAAQQTPPAEKAASSAPPQEDGKPEERAESIFAE